MALQITATATNSIKLSHSRIYEGGDDDKREESDKKNKASSELPTSSPYINFAHV